MKYLWKMHIVWEKDHDSIKLTFFSEDEYISLPPNRHMNGKSSKTMHLNYIYSGHCEQDGRCTLLQKVLHQILNWQKIDNVNFNAVLISKRAWNMTSLLRSVDCSTEFLLSYVSQSQGCGKIKKIVLRMELGLQFTRREEVCPELENCVKASKVSKKLSIFFAYISLERTQMRFHFLQPFWCTDEHNCNISGSHTYFTNYGRQSTTWTRKTLSSLPTKKPENRRAVENWCWQLQWGKIQKRMVVKTQKTWGASEVISLIGHHTQIKFVLSLLQWTNSTT